MTTTIVGRQEIADRLNVKTVTVDKWRERHPDFPTPTLLASGPVWQWVDIQAWAEKTGRL